MVFKHTLLVLLAPALLSSMAMSPPDLNPTVHDLRGRYQRAGRMVQGFTITDPDVISVRGVQIVDMRPQGDASGVVSRLLVVSPGGRAIVVTDALEPRTGRVVKRLLDDDSGWWVELWTTIGVEAEDLDHAFAISDSRYGKPDGEVGADPDSYPFAVRTRSGIAFDSKVVASDRESAFRSFLAEARESNQCGELGGDVPEGAAEAVAFLEHVALDNPLSREAALSAPDSLAGSVIAFAWNELASIVGTCLREVGVVEDWGGRGRWSVRASSTYQGIGLVDPGHLELASKFRSIESTDPLPEPEVAALLLAVRDRPTVSNSQEDPVTTP